MTKSPPRSHATVGYHWLLAVDWLTRNSGPRRAPPESNRCAYTPHELPSWPELDQVTTKLPSAAAATAQGDSGNNSWLLAVWLLTANSGPSGTGGATAAAAASRRRPSRCSASTTAERRRTPRERLGAPAPVRRESRRSANGLRNTLIRTSSCVDLDQNCLSK